MVNLKKLPIKVPLTLFVSAVVLVGCNGDDNNRSRSVEPEPREFRVTMTNLTANQPLSPAAILLHDADWTPFTLGQPASTGLEVLAEGGDNSDFLSESEALSEVYSGIGFENATGPGASGSVEITAENPESGTLTLSVVSMLVNTNDAITALRQIDVSYLEVGDTMLLSGRSYDAGTELNSESAGTIPGPAAGGEGFNGRQR